MSRGNLFENERAKRKKRWRRRRRRWRRKSEKDRNEEKKDRETDRQRVVTAAEKWEEEEAEKEGKKGEEVSDRTCTP